MGAACFLAGLVFTLLGLNSDLGFSFYRHFSDGRLLINQISPLVVLAFCWGCAAMLFRFAQRVSIRPSIDSGNSRRRPVLYFRLPSSLGRDWRFPWRRSSTGLFQIPLVWFHPVTWVAVGIDRVWQFSLAILDLSFDWTSREEEFLLALARHGEPVVHELADLPRGIAEILDDRRHGSSHETAILVMKAGNWPDEWWELASRRLAENRDLLLFVDPDDLPGSAFN